MTDALIEFNEPVIKQFHHTQRSSQCFGDGSHIINRVGGNAHQTVISEMPECFFIHHFTVLRNQYHTAGKRFLLNGPDSNRINLRNIYRVEFFFSRKADALLPEGKRLQMVTGSLPK